MRYRPHRGGRILGQGSFGAVLTMDELLTNSLIVGNKGKESSCVMKLIENGTEKENDKSNVDSVVRSLNNFCVIKAIFSDENIFNKECESIKKLASNLDINTLRLSTTLAVNAASKTLVSLIVPSAKISKHVIYRKMDGSLLNLPTHMFNLQTIIIQFEKLAKTLQIMHSKSLYHNDISPGNIMYNAQQFVFGDFGQLDSKWQVGTLATSSPLGIRLYYEAEKKLYTDDTFYEETHKYEDHRFVGAYFNTAFYQNAVSMYKVYNTQYPLNKAAMIDDMFAFHKTVHILLAKYGKSYYHPFFDKPHWVDTNTLYSVRQFADKAPSL